MPSVTTSSPTAAPRRLIVKLGTGVLTSGIGQLDTAAKTFVVRNITVNYASAGFEDGTAADLANGAVVEVKGTVSAGVLLELVLVSRRPSEE